MTRRDLGIPKGVRLLPGLTYDHLPPAPTHEAALTLLLRQGEASAAELADQLELSVQVMRRHLRSLEEKGLVEASPQALGPGRPSNRWRLTAAGRGRFPDGSEQFALGLLQSMSQALPPDQVKALLRNQAEQLASSYRQQLGEAPLGNGWKNWWSCAARRAMWPIARRKLAAMPGCCRNTTARCRGWLKPSQ